jgi:WD40 repeat protein
MRKLLLGLVLMAGVLRAFAQDAAPAPLATIALTGIKALTVSGDGNVVFAASETENTLQIYDFRRSSLLEPLAEVPLDGKPVAVASSGDYALVLVTVDGRGDLLEVIAPDPFREGSYGIVAFFDTPDDPVSVVVSPDQLWSVVTGDGWYSVLQLISAEENIGYLTESASISGVAVLSSGFALLGQLEPPSVQQYVLRANNSPRSARTLALEDTPLALTVNARLTLGAVLQADGVIVLFDLATMQAVGRIEAGGGLRDLAFIAREDGEWLIASSPQSTDVLLFDATDPNAVAAVGSLPVGLMPRFSHVTDDFLFVSDGRQVSVFDLN